ncbi:glycosyl hydrolase [Bisporella sp. PMI_857]|nr:glycosyl hydrolase [Bisporella sp. PMI_857]
MKSSPLQGSLIKTILSLAVLQTPILGKAIPRTESCDTSHYPGPINPSFEMGSLDGWKVISGNAFGNVSVSSETSYWGGSFNQAGKNFLWGFAQAGDPAVGQLHSSTFKASSVMSFLVGGGWDPVNLYIGLVRDSDGKILLSQTGTNDEAMIRVVWDTSLYAGEEVHIIVYDNSTSISWGHINLDDANQPLPNTSTISSAELYAIDPIRPQFHYTPYQGWINDPAGLIEWNGRHQLFSQFNPAAPLWGPMHWAHADSLDAVHWRELPVALQPSRVTDPRDNSGRFTGGAVIDKVTGALHLHFTDFTDLAFHPGAVAEVMVIGSGDGTKGKVQLYVSNDPELLLWEYVGVLIEGDGSTGSMWECPNFFLWSNLAITWMGNWPTSKWPSRINGWAGSQSVTRELFLREDGGLGSKPIPEVANLAAGPVKDLGQRNVSGTINRGSCCSDPHFASKTLTLDTTRAGYGQSGKWSAIISTSENNILNLDILIDRSSVEIFESTDIKIEALGGEVVFNNITLTPLGSTWKS